MNLLFLDSIEKETYGGMEEWIRLVADGLTQKGHEVTVGGRAGSEFLKRVKSESPSVDQLELDISGDFNPRTISKIKNFVETNRIHVVTVNFNKDVRLGGLAARWAGNTKVVWSLGLDITSNKWIHRALTPKLIDKAIVPSAALKKQVTSHGYLRSDNVEIIPIGIPALGFDLDHEPARKKLLIDYELPENSLIAVTSGRFVEQKGHKYLVEAAKKVIETHSEIRFLFLGNGPLEEELRTHISKLKLEKYILFAGMLDDVNEVLLGADLMVHPSIEEPFGIAILEGMRAGLPVITSRVGGIPEVVKEGKTAILVEHANQDKLSDELTELLSNKPLMDELGTNGKTRWQDKFSVDMMIDKVERCYQSVLAEEKVNG